MSPAIRGVLIVRFADVPKVSSPTPGSLVRVDLGDLRTWDINLRDVHTLAWLIRDAGSIEVIGERQDSIDYVVRMLPDAIRAQAAA